MTIPNDLASRYLLREYKYTCITIRVWKRTGTYWSCSPWLFSIQEEGKNEIKFIGVPNYCDSWRSAYMRALHRARWKSKGNWNKHYS